MSGKGLLIGLAAASLGVIYGYDISNIAGALLFVTDDFGLSTGQQELVTTAVVVGEIAGSLAGGVLANAIGRQRTMVLVAAGTRLSRWPARCRCRCRCCLRRGCCWA